MEVDDLFECFDGEFNNNLKCENRLNYSQNDNLPEQQFSRLPNNDDIHVKTILENENCTHEVSYSSKNLNIELSLNNLPAKEFPFQLDQFQKQSILCIENNQSVLVSAHTSAGKTVVAEYAIALSLKNKQRILYTTPIKALSNQKFREFSEEFNDVGLMTGDATFESSASCIVMTTEILRQMLFKGSKIIKEVKWVIFDEIHYMRDKERGVVWEETIILLPHSVRCIFLSATIPNARQFAGWITYLHKQPCNVVYTEKRPTPLHHYIYWKNNLNLVINGKGKFDEYQFISSFLKKKDYHECNIDNKTKNNLNKLVEQIIEKKWTPVIFFLFNKSDCEKHAMKLNNYNLNSEIEQNLILEIFNNAISVLSPDDQQLPHIHSMIPLLKSGIAFHHSGLLPFIKEVIEILFGEGLIKILFATETFAMGLNMPARSVVFFSMEKFDGNTERFITSGEYIQMSGRAGRRGTDNNGNVIIYNRGLIPSENVRNIILGVADPLNSAFHLTYSMILNALRQEEINPEFIISKSFLLYQNSKEVSQKSIELAEKKKNFNNNDDIFKSYFDLKEQIFQLHDNISKIIMQPHIIKPFLQPGRLVKLKFGGKEFEWGVIIKYNIKYNINNDKNYFSKLYITILLNMDDVKNTSLFPVNKSNVNKKVAKIDYITVDIKYIFKLSTEIIDINIFNCKEIETVYRHTINSLQQKYPHDLPLLHPIYDLNINDPALNQVLEKVIALEEKFLKHPYNTTKATKEKKEIYQKGQEQLDNIKNLQIEIEDIGGDLNDIFLKKKYVLRQLNYIDDADMVTLKGRVACEFTTEELVLTEIILNGFFNQIPVEYCVAILSCFLCRDQLDDNIKFDMLMESTLRNIYKIRGKIFKISKDIKLNIDSKKKSGFELGMLHVMLAWCKGIPFIEICKMTKIYEGELIRSMRSVNEILVELYKVSRIIGNTDLEVKFSEGIKLLKRGIPFASSLYL